MACRCSHASDNDPHLLPGMMWSGTTPFLHSFIRNTGTTLWLPSQPQMPTFSRYLFLNWVRLSPFRPHPSHSSKTGLHFAAEAKMCSIKLGQEDGYWYVFERQPYCFCTTGAWSSETQIACGAEQEANQILGNLKIRNKVISLSFSHLRKGLWIKE